MQKTINCKLQFLYLKMCLAQKIKPFCVFLFPKTTDRAVPDLPVAVVADKKKKPLTICKFS